MMKEDKRRCSVCDIPHFERNNYFYGKLLTERDYFAEQSYFNEKRWLINRMILGWGVVYGLDVVPVKDDPTKVLVKPGLAIDCYGREILVCEERQVQLTPEETECQRQERSGEKVDEEYFVCIEFRECMTEFLPTHPIACDQKEKCEFNRIRDSYRIYVVSLRHLLSPNRGACPAEMEPESLHRILSDRMRKSCHQHDPHHVVLAAVRVDCEGVLGEIDIYSHSKLVYGNALLYKLIGCLHHNYVSTWLVLGPIFNTTHQTLEHSANDDHPTAKEIITSNGENNYDPAKINIESAPRHGDVVHYKNSVLDVSGEYTWQTRNFIGMDWMNVHDIEDNIHQHLPGDYANPHDTKNVLNFAGKHHAIAYFLIYILSQSQKSTKLHVRSDDALRVWLNGTEIERLKYLDDRDIADYKEVSAVITLNKGTNILIAAVAETHFEWGLSVRLEDNSGLRFTPVKPQ